MKRREAHLEERQACEMSSQHSAVLRPSSDGTTRFRCTVYVQCTCDIDQQTSVAVGAAPTLSVLVGAHTHAACMRLLHCPCAPERSRSCSCNRHAFALSTASV
jgi:hypothetical protein